MKYIPSSIQEEIDRIQQNLYLKFEYLDSLAEIDEILENKDITKEERIKAILLKSEIISTLVFIGEESGSLEICMKLAKEAKKRSEVVSLDSSDLMMTQQQTWR